ncbi:MAG: nucleotidyltransferase family protein [Actinomycetales bacterium]|nr:nucleotidyltransferase family protein [Actinomycetales bacterium]
MTDLPMPMSVRVRLAHALTQRVADEHSVDLLHVKGPAVDPALSYPGRSGTDVDVLVRPAHLDTFVSALTGLGWERYSEFETGSPFEHAANYWNPDWGYIDVHRQFPGFQATPDAVFDRLWAHRERLPIAGWPCQVPDRIGQALVLLLHAARDESRGTTEVPRIWAALDSAGQAAVRGLAADLGSTVALAAALGELDEHRHARDHALWAAYSQGGSRFEKAIGLVLAQPTLRGKARAALHSVPVNTDALALRLGREPTRAEIAQEFGYRVWLGLRDGSQVVAASVRARLGRPAGRRPRGGSS